MRRLVLAAVAALVAGCPDASGDLAQAPETRLASTDEAEVVRVEAAEFSMGTDDGLFDEGPAHPVRLAAFWIDRHEVTNARFARFVEEVSYRPEGPWRRGFAEGADEQPVRFVTWVDADAYCRWAGRRLPTEAEWALAARGPDGLRYAFGDRWEHGAARAALPASAGPAPVGAHPDGASPCGALDMTGNVWEWTADWYDRWLYHDRAGRVTASPTGPEDGAPPAERFRATNTAPGNERSTLKVVRGGGWSTPAPMARATRRLFARPDAWLDDTGFRCAATEVPEG